MDLTPLNPTKNIFVAYCDEDRELALKLRETLQALLTEDVWMRDFDLDGGSLLVESLTDAAAEAKWFIILISHAAIDSQWLRTEANLATFRAIEDLDVRIVVINIENIRLPQHLKFAVDQQTTVDLFRVKDPEEEFFKLAEYIEKYSASSPRMEIYVNRGEKSDEFALAARRNRIVFVVGLAGIGKTAFAMQSVSASLGKRALSIKLTRGHSLDLLARQVMQKCHTKQPLGSDSISDEKLLALAIDALQQRVHKFFLLLDNAENGLNADNKLLPYLEDFLEAFVQAEVDTHAILTTTRIPDYDFSLATSADLLQIRGLANRYIKESIDLWLTGNDKHDELMALPALDEIVKLASGHPLAAKMLASFIKVRPVQALLTVAEKNRFELRLAQYVLQTADHSLLSELHKLILHVLAAVREPMLLEDLLSVSQLQQHSLDSIHQARLELSNWFFIQQEGELMYLHNFLASYYEEKLGEEKDLRDHIAHDVGIYSFEKTQRLARQLEAVRYDQLLPPDSEEAVRISNEIFRYAVPAAKLLRSIGEDSLADELPIQVKGTLREMVFFYYQERRDYRKALEYAENWLKFNPNDIEIMLYRIRCYRNFRNSESSARADQLLAELASRDHGTYFASRLFRERALVSLTKGDTNGAKEFFNAGINLDTLYPENYAGLADLLIKDAERLPLIDPERRRLAQEAVVLCRRARKNQSALFDRIHLGLYVDALIEAGYEDQAFPLLEEALTERPFDPRLNYHMAEILRKQGKYDEAEAYALEADRHNHQKAPLSLANIMFEQAQAFFASGDVQSGTSSLERALRAVGRFRAEYGGDQEVADTIKAKIYRAMNLLADARAVVERYEGKTSNSYTIGEQCKIDLADAVLLADSEEYAKALPYVHRAIARINAFAADHKVPEALKDVLDEAERLKATLN
jgi:hypothetical protein